MKTVAGSAQREFIAVSETAADSAVIGSGSGLHGDCDGDCGGSDCDCQSDCGSDYDGGGQGGN